MKKVLTLMALSSMLLCTTSCWNSNKHSGNSEEISSIEDATDNVDSKSNGSAAKWDSVLDDYEKMVDQYISLYKKAASGDMKALNEYTKMLQTIQSMASKMDESDGTMTTKQLNRYMAITKKMTDAAYN